MTPERFEHYKLNISSIDDAHWDLLQQMVTLKNLANNGGIEEALSMMGDLYDRFDKHFIEEEQYMADINYPYINGHVTAHRLFRATILRVTDHKSKYSAIPRWRINELIEEFVKHIDYFDIQIANFVKATAKKAA